MQLTKLISILCLVFLSTAAVFAGEDASSGPAHLTNALQRHVDGGLVDYAAMAQDADFRAFVKWLETAQPLQDSSATELAFWVNAYNASAIQGVLESSRLENGRFVPPASVMDVPGFFDRETHRVAGRDLTLNQIEKKVIFPKFPDARLHFVLVCAALSCPPLQSEAYTGAMIGQKMDAIAAAYLRDPQKNRLDKANSTLYLSQIFNWYRQDFEAEGCALLDFVAAQLGPEVGKYFAENNVKIEFLEYDWELNRQ